MKNFYLLIVVLMFGFNLAAPTTTAQELSKEDRQRINAIVEGPDDPDLEEGEIASG